MSPLVHAGILDGAYGDGKTWYAGTIHTWPEGNRLHLLHVEERFKA
jgi:hypothetical protein